MFHILTAQNYIENHVNRIIQGEYIWWEWQVEHLAPPLSDCRAIDSDQGDRE